MKRFRKSSLSMKRRASNGVTSFYGVHTGTRQAADLKISVQEPINDLFSLHLTSIGGERQVNRKKEGEDG